MHLSAALVACNENIKYLQFWPLVKRAWYEVVGIPCIMIYVAEKVPPELQNDPAIIHFKPAEGWSTATQAQVIRLLYPALLKADGAIILSDMDMIPMQRDFFINKIKKSADNQFICLRGINEQEQMIYICYVAATPATFSSIFNIKQLDDIYKCLETWSAEYKADGNYDGTGWCSDQLILYKYIKKLSTDCVKIYSYIELEDFPRLDRAAVSEWNETSDEFNKYLCSNVLIDFHLPFSSQYHQRILEIYSIIPKFQNALFNF